MSLKQECIDMINLIIEPLRKNDYDFYDLETDSIRDFCEKTGEDITYSDCQGCENYGKDCPYKKMLQVDVSFWDGADCQRNYVFGRSSVKCQGICSIKNRKQLMSEMGELKSELESYKDWCAEFGTRYDEYLDYAKEFAEKLKEKYLFFTLVNTEIIPIIFHADYGMRDGKIDYRTQGNLHIVENQNVINVFCCMRDVEETKRTIRHEVLHYMLYISGLKYKDNTAIFHYLCEEHDADAYMKMENVEQELYNQLISGLGALKNLSNGQNNLEENYTSTYICMLLAVGSDEENSLYGNLCKNGKEILQLLNLKKMVG